MVKQVVYSATGKRKHSVARVRLSPGEGKILVNLKDFKEYFKRESLVTVIMEPLKLTNTENVYNITADLHGGGISGQAGGGKESDTLR